MYGEKDDGYRPSGLVKNALVAHRVFQHRDEDALTELRLEDQHDWTYFLGEQMGIQVDYGSDLHSVLLFMLREIEASLFPWPPPQSPDDWTPLVEAALKGMTPTEVYAALRAGGRWQRSTVEGGPLDALSAKLRRLLVRNLASELSGLVSRWVQWDIRDLKRKRDELIAARHAREARRRGRSERQGRPRQSEQPLPLRSITRVSPSPLRPTG